MGGGAKGTAPAGPATKVVRLTGSETPLPGRCGSKLRNSPRFCKYPPLPGKTRCRLHGGHALAGPAHPNFIHGRYSTDLPTGLAARTRAGLEDPELLSLRAELALVDARNGELLASIRDGEAGQEAPAAAARLREMEAAQRAGDGALARVKLEAVLTAIKSRHAARDVHYQVANNLRLRAYIQEREVKRLAALNQSVAVAEVARMFGVIAAFVHDIVMDASLDPRNKLVVLQGKMAGLLNRPDPGASEADGA